VQLQIYDKELEGAIKKRKVYHMIVEWSVETLDAHSELGFL
jgi:hypothetical protein